MWRLPNSAASVNRVVVRPSRVPSSIALLSALTGIGAGAGLLVSGLLVKVDVTAQGMFWISPPPPRSACSELTSASWIPRPDPWGPRPEPWRWPQLIADVITDIEVGLFNPGQMPQQRVIAAQHLDEAYEDLLSVISGQL